jgi:hypothetical protein
MHPKCREYGGESLCVVENRSWNSESFYQSDAAPPLEEIADVFRSTKL